MARKDFGEKVEDKSKALNVSSFSNEEIQEIIKENDRLKRKELYGEDEDKTGKKLTDYVIVLSRANNKYAHKKGIFFSINGVGTGKFVPFGVPTEVKPGVVENLNNHIMANTKWDNGLPRSENVHYTYSIVKEIWK